MISTRTYGSVRRALISLAAAAASVGLAGKALAWEHRADLGPDVVGDREIASVPEGEMRPHVWRFKNSKTGLAVSNNSPNAAYLVPAQIQQAYGLNNIYTSYPSPGNGVTVAIVDAYNGGAVASDLKTFSTQFGLPQMNLAAGKQTAPGYTCTPTFTIVNQAGGSTLPRYNSGWEVEINLDTQWVHAMAPCANVLLVEANSSSFSDLLTAVTYARSHANIVSMSWGADEFSTETSYDSYFPAGPTLLASSGDSGTSEWPAASPHVLSVGGTNLAVTLTNGTYARTSETAWSGSGGGCSPYENTISAQTTAFVNCGHRATPDVAMDGGTNGAVNTYISKQGGWFGVYGTSLAVQLYAGYVALINQARASHSLAALTATQADMYQLGASSYYAANFYDVTGGSANSAGSPGTGWDYVTGLGVPLAPAMLNDLLLSGQ